MMIGYVFKRTGKMHKKKLGFMKAKSAEIVVIDRLDHTHTLSSQSGIVVDHVRGRYIRIPGGRSAKEGKLPYALSEAITHTTILTAQENMITSIRPSKMPKDGRYCYNS